MGLALSLSFEFRSNQAVELPGKQGVWIQNGWYPISKIQEQLKAIKKALALAERDLKGKMPALHLALVYGSASRKYSDFQSGAYARAQCLSSPKPVSSQKSFAIGSWFGLTSSWHRGWEWADELLKGGEE